MNIAFVMWSKSRMDKFVFTLFGTDAATTKIEWIQLTPAGEFSSCDGRGPFVADEEAIFKAAKGRKLPVDINHAIDIKGAKGEPSPAVGWIEELQARDTGIWGRVNWTDTGKDILKRKEYGAISPVLITMKDKPQRVVEIARASLCNDPGLPQLNRLFNKNGENAMDKEVRAALGLSETASDKELLAALKEVKEAKASQTAMMSTMSTLKKEIGLDDKADDKKVIETFKARLTEKQNDASDLEKQITTLNKQLVEVKQDRAREKAEAFVAKGIAEFKIVPALKDHFIERHMREPEAVEKEVNAMPALMVAGLKNYEPAAEGSLTPDEKRVCTLMGVDEKAFQETKKKEKL